MDIKAAALESLPSSSRVMRNLAEKQRRDKLNSFIGELATLVPVVASSSRKLDKTSILRLSANFLRLHKNVDLRQNGHAQHGSQTAAQIGHMILDTLEGFLLVICSTGKVMYVSESVEKLLGHSQVDMMGLPFCYFVHPDDQMIVRRHLGEFLSQACASRSGSPESEGQRCIFECRLAGRPLARGEPINYERVQITGYFRTPRVSTVDESQEPKPKNKTKNGSTVDISQGNGRPNESTFVAVVRMVQQAPISTSLTIIDSMRDQYITRHLPDGKIIHTDHRISIVAGYFTEEVQGESAFSFIYTEDLHWALLGYKLMASNPNGEGFTVYRLVSRTGSLIYLRSKGFVEIDSSTQQMIGFVCVNSLLSEEEGEVEIHRIREHLTNITAEHPAVSSINAQSITYSTWSDSSNSSLPALPAASTSAAATSGSSPSKRVCLSSLAHNTSPAPSTPSPLTPSLPMSPPAIPAVSPASAAAAAAAVAAAQLRRLRTVKESVYVNRASMSGGQACTTTMAADDAASLSSLPAVDYCTSPISINGGFLGSASTSSPSPKSDDSCSPRGPDLMHQDRFHAAQRVLSPRCSASPPYPTRHGCGPIRYRKSRTSKDLIVGNSPTASTGNA